MGRFCGKLYGAVLASCLIRRQTPEVGNNCHQNTHTHTHTHTRRNTSACTLRTECKCHQAEQKQLHAQCDFTTREKGPESLSRSKKRPEEEKYRRDRNLNVGVTNIITSKRYETSHQQALDRSQEEYKNVNPDEAPALADDRINGRSPSVRRQNYVTTKNLWLGNSVSSSRPCS
jgi:hypothetical protein